jgi:hypothetical protein
MSTMSDSLKVECPHCFGTLKLKDRSADGKKVRCPKCQEAFKVQLPEEDDLEDDFADDFGDDELPEEDDSPRKSKGSSKKPVKKKRKSGSPMPWLMIGLIAVGILMAGGLVFVVAQMGGSGGGTNKIDLSYLPPDSNMVMLMKVNELFGSPLLSSAMNQPEAQQMFEQQAKTTGVSVKDIVSITIGMAVDEGSSSFKQFPIGPPGANRFGPPASQARTVTVIRTSTPLKAEEIGVNTLKGTAQTYNGKTYYKKSGPDVAGVGDSLYFPETSVAVMGLEADIKQAIDQGPKQHRRKEFDFINPGMTVIVAFAPKTIPNPSAAVESPPNMPTVQAFEQASNKTFRAGVFGVRVSDKVDLEIIMKCADAAGAGEIKKATEAMFAELKSQYEKTKNMLTLMGMNDVISLGDKSLASLKVDQSGVLVTAVGGIPSEVKTVAENLSKNMGGMMGLGGMGGGFGTPPTSQGPPGTSAGLPAGFDPSQLPPGSLPPGGLPPGSLPPGGLPPGTTLPDATTPPPK